MSSYTTQVCDRCSAQFDLRVVFNLNNPLERPVKKVKVEIYDVGNPTEVELCKHCREELDEWFYRKFLDKK